MLELGYYACELYIYIEVNVVIALLEAKLNIHDGFWSLDFYFFPNTLKFEIELELGTDRFYQNKNHLIQELAI